MSANDPAETFRQEAFEHLERLEQVLLDLERAPSDHALVDEAFRSLHTIKGSGAMFGFDRVAAFVHEFETAFDRLRTGRIEPDRDLIALALSARDHIRALIDDPDGADSAGMADTLADLRRLTGAAGSPTARSAEPATPARLTTWRIRFALPRDAMVMGTNPLLLLDELRALGDCTVTALTDRIPPLEEIEPESCYLAWDVVLTTDKPRTALDDVFLFVLDDMELKVESIDRPGPGRLGDILVERGDLPRDRIEMAVARQEPLGAMLVKAGEVSEAKVKSALAEQKHLRTDAGTAREARDVRDGGSIRVPAERLDELMDRVGELVIAQARLRQLAAASSDLHLKAVTEEIERLATELRDTTMGIRMIPIGSLFSRFRRLVHDLGRDLGKDVELTTAGEDTELDKTVIERLNDPLVHLIRNAIDHGLESPERRRASGKPARGTVHLAARHVGAEVFIVITDDGRGLDRDRIRAKAEANGLIAAGAPLSDGELFQLVFVPGFSTASEVTSVSGRGVGMDVVRRVIEGLHGSIEIASPDEGGTRITLRLPLTLAIIDGLLVRVGDGRYIIPLSAVEECVELTASADDRSRARSFLNVRGDLVPFVRLRDLFDARTPPDPYQKIVIVSAGDLRVGLVVDQVVGDHQTVIKSLSKLHADVPSFSGATILGDGTVALILDIAHLVEFGQRREERLKAS